MIHDNLTQSYFDDVQKSPLAWLGTRKCPLSATKQLLQNPGDWAHNWPKNRKTAKNALTQNPIIFNDVQCGMNEYAEEHLQRP